MGQAVDRVLLAFSPDGHTLAAGANETDIRMWTVADPSAPRQLPVLRGPGNYVTGSSQSEYAVAFVSGTDLLISGGQDQIPRTWTTDPEQAAASVCATAGSPLSRTEWAKYLPDKPYSPPCA